jgi:hypothetical protein
MLLHRTSAHPKRIGDVLRFCGVTLKGYGNVLWFCGVTLKG